MNIYELEFLIRRKKGINIGTATDVSRYFNRISKELDGEEIGVLLYVVKRAQYFEEIAGVPIDTSELDLEDEFRFSIPNGIKDNPDWYVKDRIKRLCLGKDSKLKIRLESGIPLEKLEKIAKEASDEFNKEPNLLLS